MKDLEIPQSELRDIVSEIEFEGTPETFKNVAFGYIVSHQQDTYPDKWMETPDRPVIYLKRKLGAFELSIDILATSLPKNRSKLQIFITAYNYEESYAIVKKFIEYLKHDGWVEKEKKLPKRYEERIKIFEEKKKQKPELTLEMLAMEVNDEYKDDYITPDIIRTTYKVTHTQWIRGERRR